MEVDLSAACVRDVFPSPNEHPALRPKLKVPEGWRLLVRHDSPRSSDIEADTPVLEREEVRDEQAPSGLGVSGRKRRKTVSRRKCVQMPRDDGGAALVRVDVDNGLGQGVDRRREGRDLGA